MQKSARNFAIVALLSLASAPMMMAERMGGIPHPQAIVTPTASLLSAAQYAVLAYFGA